ncbi:23S rRNA (uracil1939-C5)-methyltransferase [Caldicoprobacter guelmensis]|uniref:23S rRNA (uracil(1939)-C(5))-methyltransferase RlmD n=1 Tax=Caldicoprobacter guelmensis TaxID=1170224 RepID=UPI001958B114|nr:23S rRNA (uracil(1939)-C(5))-methyltransferase RlmD [Caldicoprobacter guelmensis]MBM7581541.1 23S rRNA (uracil1939-C5)-methyltransferase [Caldicoprobacter guelmensis]
MKQKDMPVSQNQEYEMTIEDISVDGEGIGRINGFTMFVPGALPGEKVRIKALRIGKNYGYGKLLKIIEPSPDRVVPPCSYSKQCGGCSIQHLSYNAQLKFKTRRVRDALERIGKITGVKVHDTIGMVEPWRYRNKAQFPVGRAGSSLAIGFFAPKSHDIVDMDRCMINHQINDKIIEVIRNFIQKYSIPVYDECAHQGIVRHVVTKVGFKTGQVMFVIVTNGKNLPHKDKLVELLRNNIPGITSIVQNINSKKTNVILGQENITLWGQDYIVDILGRLTFKISPLSFFQVNPVQTEILYNKVLEYATLTGKETVIDLYSGIGTISLFLARNAHKVYGIEEVPQAVQDAWENARINGITNAEFIEGKAEVVIPELVNSGLHADVVVLDPPRKGCEAEVLEALARMAPQRIVYVSCNPATLARDLKLLTEHGYEVVDVQPVDMFPHTTHVECVASLKRKHK